MKSVSISQGFILPAADSHSLAAVIVKLFQNPIISAGTGQRSLRRMSQYTIERAVDGFEATIEFAVQQR